MVKLYGLPPETLVPERPGRGAADSKRAQAELEKLNAERKRAEAQWREQLDAANNLKGRIEASLFEALERLKAREQEVARLKLERDDFQARLTSGQQAAAQFKQQVDQFGHVVASPARDIVPNFRAQQVDAGIDQMTRHRLFGHAGYVDASCLYDPIRHLQIKGPHRHGQRPTDEQAEAPVDLEAEQHAQAAALIAIPG